MLMDHKYASFFLLLLFNSNVNFTLTKFISDLNLLEWSSNNHIGLALGSAVYLWNASNGSISQVMELENPDEYISSVSWIKEGNIVAVGNSLGAVQV